MVWGFLAIKAHAQEALLGTHRVSSSIPGPQQLEELRRVLGQPRTRLVSGDFPEVGFEGAHTPAAVLVPLVVSSTGRRSC